MIAKLEQIDEILEGYEDWMHGQDGDNCTKARKLIIDVMKEVKIISFNPLLSDSLATCQRCHKPKPSDRYLMCPTCYGDF